jgi:membrane protein implicated in regulation of membrane protease activity
MITIPVEDWVFVLCLLVGGGLLLVTVLVDDVLGGILDALNIGFDIGGVSLMPLALGFVSMFGAAGLFATQVLDVHGGQAAAVATIGGFIGFGIVFALFKVLQGAEGSRPFTTKDLVGQEAYVSVGIPAGHYGSVLIKAEGQTHEFSATAASDIPPGTLVTVTGVAGSGLYVALRATTAGDGSAAAPGETNG